MAEYYSAELSQKIKRGMGLKRERCLYTGGTLTLGYKVRKEEIGKNGRGEILYDNYIELDPVTAPVIRKIFEMYAAGNPIVKINEHLNAQQFKTIRGGFFNKNSLRNILQNKRYIGIFTWKGGEVQDGIPRIVSDELFYKVQTIMSENKKAPARSRAEEDYILTTKLFCGLCKSMMTGVSGTSKTGKIYNYYTCNRAKIKECEKKQVGKKWIEDLVIAKCREILTDENIDIIAAAVVSAYEKSVDDANLKRLQKLLKENEKSIDNLFKALEAGQVVEQITKRIQEKNIERGELEKQIASEEIASERLTERDIRFFLKQLQKGDANDIRNRKAIITVFVNAVYLYDDKITFILNAGEKPIEITEQLLNDVEQASGFVYGQLNTTNRVSVLTLR